MQQEDWHEHLGRAIGASVTIGGLGAIAGVVWSLVFKSPISTGALWAGSISAIVTFFISFPLSRPAVSGMMMMIPWLYLTAIVAGLITWLIKSII